MQPGGLLIYFGENNAQQLFAYGEYGTINNTVFIFWATDYVPSSVKGFQNHFLSKVSRKPSLHFVSLGNSMSSILSTFSSRNCGSLRSNSVCNTTCKVRDGLVPFSRS